MGEPLILMVGMDDNGKSFWETPMINVQLTYHPTLALIPTLDVIHPTSSIGCEVTF